MTDAVAGEAHADSREVQRAAAKRIRLEALRQLQSVDIDDPDSRVDPLPGFGRSTSDVVD